MSALIHVTVYEAPTARQVREVALTLSVGATVHDALIASGLGAPGLNDEAGGVGVWGRKTTLTQPLLPTSGSLLRCLPIHTSEYLDLVDWTGRQLREGKRGAIPIDVPHTLLSVDPSRERWITRVKAIGSGYWRVVGDAQDLIAIAERIGQRWVKGLGLAKRIARPA